MKHSTQVRLIHEIFEAIDRGTPPMAEKFSRNDTSAYTSAERAAREREVLFRHHPIVAGFSSQIPNPGDYLTEDLAPVPILGQYALSTDIMGGKPPAAVYFVVAAVCACGFALLFLWMTTRLFSKERIIFGR